MLSFQLENFVLLFLSLALFISDMLLSLAYVMQGFASKLTSKMARVKLAQPNLMDRLYTVTWLLVGLAGIWLVGLKISVISISIFLSFKSGADLGSRIAYGFHDISLLDGQSITKKIIGKAVGIAALPSVFFLVIWKVFQRILSSLASELLGVGVDVLTLSLWIAGLAFGLLYGILRSRGESGILLRGELALVLGFKLARE